MFYVYVNVSYVAWPPCYTCDACIVNRTSPKRPMRDQFVMYHMLRGVSYFVGVMYHMLREVSYSVGVMYHMLREVSYAVGVMCRML